MNIQISVENIKCRGCMNSIKTALQKMANVQIVRIDQDTQTIFIDGDEPLDRNEIVRKLESMGYPETGKNNMITTAKSYISCVIGRVTEKIQ